MLSRDVRAYSVWVRTFVCASVRVCISRVCKDRGVHCPHLVCLVQPVVSAGDRVPPGAPRRASQAVIERRRAGDSCRDVTGIERPGRPVGICAEVEISEVCRAFVLQLCVKYTFSCVLRCFGNRFDAGSSSVSRSRSEHRVQIKYFRTPSYSPFRNTVSNKTLHDSNPMKTNSGEYLTAKQQPFSTSPAFIYLFPLPGEPFLLPAPFRRCPSVSPLPTLSWTPPEISSSSFCFFGRSGVFLASPPSDDVTAAASGCGSFSESPPFAVGATVASDCGPADCAVPSGSEAAAPFFRDTLALATSSAETAQKGEGSGCACRREN